MAFDKAKGGDVQQVIKELNKALELLKRAQRGLVKRDELGAIPCAQANLGQAIHSTKATIKNIRQEQEET